MGIFCNLFHQLMKTLIFIILLFPVCAFAQTQKVIRVNNATVRMHIERFTQQYTFPDVIQFVQDANGNWITSIENLENFKYVGIRQDLIEYMRDNGIQTTAKSLREVLQNFGAQIDYVKPGEPIETINTVPR